MTDGHHPTELQDLLNWVPRRWNNNYHAIFALWGDPGKGKSALAQEMAIEIDPDFDPYTQTVLHHEEMLQVSRSVGERRAIIVDEAIIAGGNRRRAMHGSNLVTMEHINTGRKRLQAWFFIAPRLGDLDKSIQEHCHWALQVYERGRVRAWENNLVGLKNSKSWLTDRFEDVFPDPWEAIPDQFTRYHQKMDLYKQGGAEAVMRRERASAQYQVAVDRVLAQEGLLHAPAGPAGSA